MPLLKQLGRTAFAAQLLFFSLINSSFAETLPKPDHVVVVIEENHSYSQIMDMHNSASWIHALAKRGTLFSASYGITHPSQPNYLALFSGSTQGVTSDACPYSFENGNLASALLGKGLSFATYSESLPATGDLSCSSHAYYRKHNPASNWHTVLPADTNRRFADFPTDFSKLPTVSFVIPNQDNDMHDGNFETADSWLKQHVDPYLHWAYQHNSLLILTWDEDDYSEDNHITTILAGPMVNATISNQHINHYNVLRTLLDFYGLPQLRTSSDVQAIRGIWAYPR